MNNLRTLWNILKMLQFPSIFMVELEEVKHFSNLCVFAGGIPPPIYFGALVDRTCLKWGLKRCGGQGACRLYDSQAFRYSHLNSTDKWMDGWMDFIITSVPSLPCRITFLGLVYCLYGLANMLWVVLYLQLSKRQKKLELRSQAKATALEANGNNNPNAMVSIFKNKDDLDRDSESTI